MHSLRLVGGIKCTGNTITSTGSYVLLFSFALLHTTCSLFPPIWFFLMVFLHASIFLLPLLLFLLLWFSHHSSSTPMINYQSMRHCTTAVQISSKHRSCQTTVQSVDSKQRKPQVMSILEKCWSELPKPHSRLASSLYRQQRFPYPSRQRHCSYF